MATRSPGVHRPLVSWLALLHLAILLAPSAHAATIRVPEDQPTIQAGIDAAAPGDTVLVAAGIYAGPGNRDLGFAGKAITLRSAAGPAATVIDGEHVAFCFHFQAGETPAAAVDGFTIRNGSDGTTYGGGAFIEGASPTFRSCVFTQNTANQGGGIYAQQSSAVLESCAFTSNMAFNWGGGVYFIGSTPAFAGCTFTGNSAAVGAGAYFSGGSVFFADCTFEGNTAANHGGGVYCRNGATATLDRCTFTGNSGRSGGGMYSIESSAAVDSSRFSLNTASYQGGALYNESGPTLVLTHCTFTGNSSPAQGGGGVFRWYGDTTTVTDCSFIDNRTSPPTGWGAGMFINRGVSTITRCVFSGNAAAWMGGGLHADAFTGNVTVTDCSFTDNSATEGGGLLTSSSATVLRTSFARNHASAEGGGARAWSPVTFEQCTFTGNTASYGGGVAVGFSLAIVRDCDISGNTAGLGGGLYVWRSTGRITNTRIEGNSATHGGALFSEAAYDSLSGCTLAENSADLSGGLFLKDCPSVHLRSCTLARNAATDAGGAALYDTTTIALDYCIVAQGLQGAAIHCDPTSLAVLACCDVHANAGGDWVGCIADQYGINGCFAADPEFCAPSLGDFTLAETSPCAPAHSPAGCGLIGAHPVGCERPIGVVGEAPPPGPAAWLRVLPNPIAPESVIEWEGGAAAALVLRLYDPAGRLVAARAAGPPPAWPHRLGWRALAGERPLPAGVYFLELGGGGRTPAARVVIAR